MGRNFGSFVELEMAPSGAKVWFNVNLVATVASTEAVDECTLTMSDSRCYRIKGSPIKVLVTLSRGGKSSN